MRTKLLRPLALAILFAGFQVGCDDDETEDNTDGGVLADGGTTDGGNVGDAGAPDGSIPVDLTFQATLTGAEENPPVTTTATGSATLTLRAGAPMTLQYRLTHTVVAPTGAHIHRGHGGINGQVVAALDKLDGTEGSVALTAADREDLLAGRLYINVHTSTHARGEIRGQILAPGEKLFTTHLTGAQETPPVASTFTGTAAVILNAAKDQIRYELTNDVAAPTMVHLHVAPAGSSGGPVVTLQPAGQRISGTAAIDAEEAAHLEAGRLYVNVHTAANSNGEIRGQLLLPGETLFVAVLSGANEVPPVTTNASGSVQLVLNPAKDQIRYESALSMITPMQAHIHRGAPGANGSVVLPLTLTGGRFAGTAALSTVEVDDMTAGRFYVNVHTMAHGSGEIRGQVLRPGQN